jgi:hypothetical protein
MERRGIERFAPLSGVVFFVLVVASLVIGGEGPGTDESIAETVEFWQDDETNQIISALLGAYAAFALVWFGASLREVVAQAEGGRSRLASISFAGAVITAMSGLIAAWLEWTAAEAADELSPQGLQAISILYSDFFFPFAIGLGLFLLPAGLAAVRYGAFDRWLGWMAIVIGAICITPLGFIGWLAGIAWVLIASIVLYRKKDPVGSGAAPPPTSGPSIEVPPGAGPPPPA